MYGEIGGNVLQRAVQECGVGNVPALIPARSVSAITVLVTELSMNSVIVAFVQVRLLYFYEYPTQQIWAFSISLIVHYEKHTPQTYAYEKLFFILNIS